MSDSLKWRDNYINPINKLDYWCLMCGAAPGELCTVVEGFSGQSPGDPREYPHQPRHLATQPVALIPNEPAYYNVR